MVNINNLKLKSHDFLIRVLSAFIPSSKLRKKFRRKFFSMPAGVSLFLVSENGDKTSVKSIRGLRILGKGNNNVVEVHSNAAFNNSVIRLESDNARVQLGSGKYYNCLITTCCGDNQILTIGNNFTCFGVELHLQEEGCSIKIGDNCLFSSYINIWPTDGHSVIRGDEKFAYNLAEPIVIGNHVWVGQHVKICKGAQISDNSIVGIGSLVFSKFLEENIVIAGNPAAIVKRNINWDCKNPQLYNSLVQK